MEIKKEWKKIAEDRLAWLELVKKTKGGKKIAVITLEVAKGHLSGLQQEILDPIFG